MKLKYYFLLVILALFTSCSNELGMQDNLNDSKILLSSDEYISIAYDNPGIITSEEAKQLVLDFNPTGLQTRNNNVKIMAISTYNVSSSSGLKTRVGSTNLTTIPVYKIEFLSDEGKGVAYVPADERFAKIMAYLPKTDLKDSVKYVDSKSMLYLSELSLLEDAKYYEKVKSELRAKTLAKIAKTLNVKAVRYDEIQDIIIVKDEILSRSGPTFPVGNPIGFAGLYCSSTEWNQDAPYNDLLQKENCDLYDTGSPTYEAVPAGCAVISIAQIMASLEPDLTVDGLKIDWNILKAQKQIIAPSSWQTPSSETTREMVAKLIKYIYIATNTQPVRNSSGYVTGSGTYSSDTSSFFYRFFSTSGLKNGWDGNAAFQSLQLAKLVWVAATSNRGGSHAFILDGFAYWRPQTRYLVKNFGFYFHTNMGWGGYYDGFYLVNKDLSITFDTSNGSYDRNFSMIYNIINK